MDFGGEEGSQTSGLFGLAEYGFGTRLSLGVDHTPFLVRSLRADRSLASRCWGCNLSGPVALAVFLAACGDAGIGLCRDADLRVVLIPVVRVSMGSRGSTSGGWLLSPTARITWWSPSPAATKCWLDPCGDMRRGACGAIG